jgi:hypothetical protein
MKMNGPGSHIKDNLIDISIFAAQKGVAVSSCVGAVIRKVFGGKVGEDKC